MPLRGELSSVDLAHIFQMLLLNQKAGVLEIEHDGVKRPLFFRPDGVLVPYEEEILVERAVRHAMWSGRVEEKQVERARCNMGVLKKNLLDTLVEMKLLDASERLSLMRQQLEEDVYELFFVRDAGFEFRDGEEPSAEMTVDVNLALSPNALIMEAARRIDEWEYIKRLVPSSLDIIEACGDLKRLPAKEVDAELRAVHAALDGESTVADLIESTGIARFVVFRKIAFLVEHKLAMSVPPDRLIARAEKALQAERPRSAVHLYERALELGANDVAVLNGAGRAHESLGEHAIASERYLAAGRRAEEDGDLEAALRFYLRIRELLPTQVEARERLFALRKVAATAVVRGRVQFDPVAEGFELAEILAVIGRSEELALVLAGLMDLADRNPAAIERVAELAGRLSQTGVAIDALIRAADCRARGNDFPAALRDLKRAQALDPSRAAIADRIRSMHERARVRGERRRAAMRVVALIAVFVLLFFGYGRFGALAMERYGENSLEDFVATARFDEGREYYRSICRRFPLTIPMLLSLENLRELDIAEKNHAEVTEFKNEIEAEDGASRMKQARYFKEAAFSARFTGNYASALKHLKRAKELAGPSDPLELAAPIADLEKYLGEARRLQSEATFFRNAGRFPEAHARLLELVKSYPNAPGVDGLSLPVEVTSDPPRARIVMDGQPVRIGDSGSSVYAETPFVLDLPRDRAVTVELVADGFAPFKTQLDARTSSVLAAELCSRPDREVVLNKEIVGSPACDAEGVVVALAGGRVVSLDPSTLQVRWSFDIPDLAEAAGAPVIVGRRVLVVDTLRRFRWIDRTSGDVGASGALPSDPAGRGVASDSSAAWPLSDGTLALLDSGSGSPRIAQPPASRVAGPVALRGDRFASACADGRAWVALADGSLSAARTARPLEGGATALAASGSVVCIGDARGNLHVLDVDRGGEGSSMPVFQDAAIERIDAAAETVVAAGGGRVAVVSVSSRRATATAAAAGVLADGGGADIVALATADGTVRSFRRADLSPAGRVAAEAAIAAPGTGTSGRFWFSAAGGRVIGIFPQSR